MVERAPTPNQEPPITWEAFDAWYDGLSSEDRLNGSRNGQWPEGTPQQLATLATRITPQERLLRGIFGESLNIEEILARSADYNRIREERSRQISRNRVAESRGVPIESVTDADVSNFYQEEHRRVKEEVLDVLATLTPREKSVLEQRFGLEDGRPKTLVEVGRSIDRSESTIRRIEKSALKKLRNPSRSLRLKDYLEHEQA